MDILIGGIIVFSVVVAAAVLGPTIKMAMDIAPFMYTNTRCSGRAGQLLDKKAYENLLATNSEREVLAFLEETSYRHIAEHGNDFSKFSSSLEGEMAATYAWLESIMPEKLAPIVRAMQQRFEVQEMKHVLNQVKRGGEVGELSAIRDENLRLKLESVGDFNALVAAVQGTAYEPVLANRDLSQLSQINSDLDRQYMGNVLQAIETIKDKKSALPFRNYWRRMIDLANIRLALRKVDAKSEEITLIPGGFLSMKKLGEASDASQVHELLQQTPYSEFLAEDVENALFKFMKKEAGLAGAQHPLKGGPIIRYIIMKELEIRNLNIAVKLKGENFAAEEIAKVLVI